MQVSVTLTDEPKPDALARLESVLKWYEGATFAEGEDPTMLVIVVPRVGPGSKSGINFLEAVCGIFLSTKKELTVLRA